MNIKMPLAFVGGFVCGVAASYLIATHYFGIEWVYANEPESPDANDTDANTNDDELKNDMPITDISKSVYNTVVGNEDYKDYAHAYGNSSDEPVLTDWTGEPVEIAPIDLKPRIIDAAEYGEEVDYDEIDLQYYSNEELLTDDWNYPVENVDQTIGEEAMDILRKGSSDVVYVANDLSKSYYEIKLQSIDYPGISG